MSDIDLKFGWWELLLFSPIIGWPGLLLGATLGALGWKRRRIVGGAIGAIVGNLAWAIAALYLK
jgi:Na+/proline symporter